jgi:hypothetical protein
MPRFEHVWREATQQASACRIGWYKEEPAQFTGRIVQRVQVPEP